VGTREGTLAAKKMVQNPNGNGMDEWRRDPGIGIGQAVKVRSRTQGTHETDERKR
jgi:hypothetical protein